MSKKTLLNACSIALLLCLPLACEKDDDDGSGDDASDSAMTSDGDGDAGDTEVDTEADDFGDETGVESTTSTSSTSSTTSTSTTDAGDDGSAACESFFDCPTIVCACPDGSTVETASCVDGMCASEDDCAEPPHDACG